MTVALAPAYAERAWTGVETIFSTGIPARSATHVRVLFRNAEGDILGPLARGTAYGAFLSSEGLLQLTPLALPAAPGTLLISRVTPAEQTADFQVNYGPEVHNALHDAHVLRHQEVAHVTDRALTSRPGDPIRELPAYSAADDGKMLVQRDGRLAFQDAGDIGLDVLAQVIAAGEAAQTEIAGQVAVVAAHADDAEEAATAAEIYAQGAAADRAVIESLLALSLDAGDQEDPPGAVLDHGEQT